MHQLEKQRTLEPLSVLNKCSSKIHFLFIFTLLQLKNQVEIVKTLKIQEKISKFGALPYLIWSPSNLYRCINIIVLQSILLKLRWNVNTFSFLLLGASFKLWNFTELVHTFYHIITLHTGLQELLLSYIDCYQGKTFIYS